MLHGMTHGVFIATTMIALMRMSLYNNVLPTSVLVQRIVTSIRNVGVWAALVAVAEVRLWIRFRAPHKYEDWYLCTMVPTIIHWVVIEAVTTVFHSLQHTFPTLYALSNHGLHHSIESPRPADALYTSIWDAIVMGVAMCVACKMCTVTKDTHKIIVAFITFSLMSAHMSVGMHALHHTHTDCSCYSVTVFGMCAIDAIKCIFYVLGVITLVFICEMLFLRYSS